MTFGVTSILQNGSRFIGADTHWTVAAFVQYSSLSNEVARLDFTGFTPMSRARCNGDARDERL